MCDLLVSMLSAACWGQTPFFKSLQLRVLGDNVTAKLWHIKIKTKPRLWFKKKINSNPRVVETNWFNKEDMFFWYRMLLMTNLYKLKITHFFRGYFQSVQDFSLLYVIFTDCTYNKLVKNKLMISLQGHLKFRIYIYIYIYTKWSVRLVFSCTSAL